MLSRCLAVALAAFFVWPMSALAQSSRAGVVTALEGNVTAQGVTRTAPTSLKFKDDVFHQDRITTGDRSLARMLLDGKAVVTVRERSVLTITQQPNRAVVELTDGKFALAVARERMKPGDSIEIRTPNAVAGVRGTVVIAEVTRTTAQVGAVPAGVVTSFYVLRGSIDASTLGQAGAPTPINPLQQARFAGSAPMNILPISPGQIGQITAGLQPTGKSAGGAGQADIKTQAMQNATTLLAALTGEQASFTGTLPPSLVTRADLLDKPAQTDQTPGTTNTLLDAVNSPITPVTGGSFSEVANQCSGCVRVANTSLFVSGQPFHTLSGVFGSASTLELVGFESSEVLHSGSPSFIDVTSGANIGLYGSLANIVNTEIFTSGTFLDVNGHLTGLGAVPLVTIDPSFIAAGDAFISLNGATVTLAGQLLTDVSGTLVANAEFLRMVNSTLTSTTPLPLVQLTGSDVGSASALTMTNSHMQLAGPLVALVGLGEPDGDASFVSALFGIDQGSTLTSTGTAALIQITSTGLEHPHSIFQVTNGSSVTLNGGLFSIVESSLAPDFRVVELIAGALALKGPAVSALNAAISAPLGLIGLFDGSSITSTSTSPLVVLTGSGLDNATGGGPPGQGALLGASGTGSSGQVNTVSLQGPLATIVDSSVSIFAGIIDLFDGSTLTSTTLDPLVTLQGGTHSFGTRALVHLEGRQSTATGSFSYEVDTGEGLESFTVNSVGTDRMLSTGGILLDVNGATVTSSQGGVTVDTALLEASAPLLNLRNGASVTLGSSALELVKQARMDVIGPVVRLDASTLNILGNHVITVGGGAFPSLLNVTGSLIALANSSTLNVSNGALLSVFNSVAKITGALIAFGPGSNVVNLTNTLCSGFSCFTQNGITVALGAGASSSQVTIGTGAISGTGTINLGPSAAHVVVGGSQAKVTIAVP